MLAGTNQDGGQRYNRRVIFDLVRRHEDLSKAELARLTGLSYQTVSNIADDLLTDRLLLETRTKAGRRGQPPVQLSINPNGAFSLGVFIDRDGLRGALVDLTGVPRAEHEVGLASTNPKVVLPAIVKMADHLLHAGGAPADRLLGLGLSMPGLSRAGRLVTATRCSSHEWLSDWADIPIIPALEKDIRVPIFTDNDAAAAAIGELVHGGGRHLSNFVYVHISDGIGAGLVLDRRPYRGSSGLAGEFGHLTVMLDGAPCPCGRRGCLEAYASFNAARKRVPGLTNAASATELLAARDPALANWLIEAGYALRNAIVSIENLLDPEAVFIGGTIPAPLLDALLDAVTPLPPRIASDIGVESRVLRAGSGLASATLGAAALPIFAETSSDLSVLFRNVNGSMRAAE